MPTHGRITLFVIINWCWASGWSQIKAPPPVVPTAHQDELQVNWLYGAFVPKDAPLLPLTGHQRVKLYVRQSFTTPGIYLKIGLFSLGDQITNNPSAWGRGPEGFGRRLASREGQFVIQNSFSTLGNAMLQYEPRYDLCHCSGFWPRTRHALIRNFVTYNQTERELRPHLALYGAALGAGMMSSLWKPGDKVWVEGYRSVLTQAGFGVLANWIGEFAPEIVRAVRRKKPASRK